VDLLALPSKIEGRKVRRDGRNRRRTRSDADVDARERDEETPVPQALTPDADHEWDHRYDSTCGHDHRSNECKLFLIWFKKSEPLFLIPFKGLWQHLKDHWKFKRRVGQQDERTVDDQAEFHSVGVASLV
jgi:ABC-type nickel/cobalt efflux system permease component RcnA